MPKAMTLLELKTKMGDPMARAVASLLWKWSGVLPLLTIIPAKDLTYSWLEEGNLPEVGGRGLNEDFGDQEEGKDARKYQGLAIMGGKIKTDVIHIEQKGEGARTNRIQRKMRATGRLIDRLFFNGDRQKNPKKEFDGLKKLIPASKTIVNATNGATPDHKKFVKLIDAVQGGPDEKVLFMNRNTRYGLSLDVGTGAGGRNVMDVGKQLTSFEGVRIVEVFNDEKEAEILGFTETTGSSNLTASAYCCRVGSTIPEDGVQLISGLAGTISHRGPIDLGAYIADWIHLVAAVQNFSVHDAARLQGILTTA